ncbi:putative transmembrane protein [Thalictrum thalictroides]|uniref:Putative transmembrane protein n=1 Tax=Thalictrum thalictroides TaxID=46969 RepID=A0A7J6X6M3_THATH|nr:putative transmembrane protein [Thalictrum thalictroides]
MDITERVKKIWGAWDIRFFILLSLLCQILLVLLAPLRKRYQQKRIANLIWLLYLLADWVAIFGLGLLSNSQDESSGSNGRDDLLALWAPFFLLHLGGPDTITAFALEDNELWLRHLFGLISQFVPAGYVFLRAIHGNKLLVPEILIFIVGLVKYAERTYSLYRASSNVFKDYIVRGIDPGTNYYRQLCEYNLMKETQSLDLLQGRDIALQGIADHLGDIHIIRLAYYLFQTFKGYIADIRAMHYMVSASKEVFLMRPANDVFRLIEIELNFMYDVLYSKAILVYSRTGYCLRFLCSILLLLAFFLFLFFNKHDYNEYDMAATYTLFIGALSLEAVGLFNLIFSDWTIATLRNYPGIAAYLDKFICFFFGSRWSGSVSQVNLLDLSLVQRSTWLEKIGDSLCIKSILDEIYYKTHTSMDEKIQIKICSELKDKSLSFNLWKANDLLSSRGQWVLKRGPNTQLLWSVELEFEESLLVWHIATEICYQTTRKEDTIDANTDREICKVLSDYIVYLMVMQPNMMSTMGIWLVKYEETCKQAKNYFQPNQGLEEQCGMLIGKVRSNQVGITSVFYNAVRLVELVSETDGKYKWTLMSSVWVEILSYVASHCTTNAHAQQLSKGRELVTFVWLLMIHLGLREYSETQPVAGYRV